MDDKTHAAVVLRLAGWTYTAIATALGYADAADARTAVEDHIKEATDGVQGA